jgi:wyosine [tRNA(Phe)-imidazoG37] synthetase (radical SAM superfamily)
MADRSAELNVLALHTDHARLFQENRFVYPVLSRRSHGISVGINLNPDKVCNFDCIYCQVDRRTEAETTFVEVGRLMDELDRTLDLATSGVLFEDERFTSVPAPLRRLNDIAFSGDGEPTTFRNFDRIVAEVANLKERRGLPAVKLVLITNASMFHRPNVKRALALLDGANGEIWAKLDAGTEAYYHRVERTSIPFRQILDNLRSAAQVRPLVIQSLFMKVEGQGPSDVEFGAYCDRLNEILAAGGAIDRIQIYTVARRPAEDFVAPLDRNDVDRVSHLVRSRVGVRVEAYYGPAS